MAGIVGIDEVGRGSWAGPLLVVAARSVGRLPSGVADSKTLTRAQRNELLDALKSSCVFGEGWVQPEEIDYYGLTKAMRIGVSRALIMLDPATDDNIIIDGNVNYCPPEFTNVSCIIKADSLHPLVSAASVYAKLKRDEYMIRAAQFYPQYQFAKHVGYGTKVHRELLERFGPCILHRRSFKPIKAISTTHKAGVF